MRIYRGYNNFLIIYNISYVILIQKKKSITGGITVMKTLQELYEEVKASDDLKRALAEAVKSDNVTDFLKAHGFDSTADELREFVAEKVNRNRPLRELSEDELANVAGGLIIPILIFVVGFVNAFDTN